MLKELVGDQFVGTLMPQDPSRERVRSLLPPSTVPPRSPVSKELREQSEQLIYLVAKLPAA